MFNGFLVRIGLGISLAIFVAIFKIAGIFAVRDHTTRQGDIDKWKLAKNEIASYDACRTALGTTSGAVAPGSFCGCLVVSGATTLQSLPAQKLKPILVAGYTAATVPASAKAAVQVQMASAIETGSTRCRTPAPKREARITIGGESHTAREWREMARREAESDDDGPRVLPLVSE